MFETVRRCPRCPPIVGVLFSVHGSFLKRGLFPCLLNLVLAVEPPERAFKHTRFESFQIAVANSTLARCFGFNIQSLLCIGARCALDFWGNARTQFRNLFCLHCYFHDILQSHPATHSIMSSSVSCRAALFKYMRSELLWVDMRVTPNLHICCIYAARAFCTSSHVTTPRSNGSLVTIWSCKFWRLELSRTSGFQRTSSQLHRNSIVGYGWCSWIQIFIGQNHLVKVQFIFPRTSTCFGTF